MHLQAPLTNHTPTRPSPPNNQRDIRAILDALSNSTANLSSSRIFGMGSQSDRDTHSPLDTLSIPPLTGDGRSSRIFDTRAPQGPRNHLAQNRGNESREQHVLLSRPAAQTNLVDCPADKVADHAQMLEHRAPTTSSLPSAKPKFEWGTGKPPGGLRYNH